MNDLGASEEYHFTESKLPHLNPMAKRAYKEHKNGHGIKVWNCEDCKTELTDIEARNNVKRICPDCKLKRRQKSQRDRYHRLKNAKSKESLTDLVKIKWNVKIKRVGRKVQIDQ